jgi:hypothetical protein
MNAPGLASTVLRQINPCCTDNCFGRLVELAVGIGESDRVDGTVNVGPIGAGPMLGQHNSQRTGLVTLGPTTATLSGVYCTCWFDEFNSDIAGWLADTSLATLASSLIIFSAI